ncbi:hypothetical protein ACFXAW_01620 [Streptomyces sp. NPDC059445]|uniref:hypothetical protein n=1 Tax=Streptomyces sp. NPDC059445 TaxID=3346832 RepID=UPI0036ABD39B
MVRYAHFQLMATVESSIALAVAAPVVLGVHGLSSVEGRDVTYAVLGVAGLSAFFGLPAGLTRVRCLGGERHYFDAAVPLSDPGAVLPSTRRSLRHSFDGSSAVVFGLLFLVMGLVWNFWTVLFAYGLVAPERVARGLSVLLWERRHGLLLWRGRVEEQPLEHWRSLYSSPRATTAG